jgi:tRNA-2-methylthio-N6-dimethylallyladenosine synthase
VKKLFIKTYGCQMNEYDSARMAELLAPLGYQATDRPDDADLVILNTCHIREKAEAKVHSELGRLRRVKEARRAEGKPALLAVAGCVAQAEGAEIVTRQPAVDMVFGPQALHRLPEMVARASRGAGALLETRFEVERKFDELPQSRDAQGPSAFLTVQEGCARILAEARALAAAGAREIMLLGQNVNGWHGAAAEGGGEWRLGQLLRHLAAKVEGLERLRYTTSHPRDMDEALIAAHGDLPQLMPFLHLPVQSGSDRVLVAMGRRHGADDYRRIVERLRNARPDIALSSDFIVGFPGESETDFEATLALVREIGFAQAYSFRYSARPGTPASALDDQLPETVKAERLERLQALLAAQQFAFNRSAIGRVMPVLFERRGRHPGQLAGRSPYMQAVHLAAPEESFGRVRDVEITVAFGQSLTGRLVESQQEPATMSGAFVERGASVEMGVGG